MRTMVLAASAAAVALAAGPGLAGETMKPAKLVGPGQPIPYAQLNAYLKASAKARASRDWWTPELAAAPSAEGSATPAAATEAKPAKKAKARR